jgi:asparagine synthase (glutamine-hydrolysing)
MCGIAGFWNRNGNPPDLAVLKQMAAALQHRGPDDQGEWTGNGVGLSLTRLSILDLSKRAHQPFVTDDGSAVIAYNGEVYNFRELRAELEQAGISFHSNCDTEVVLHALHHWGPEAAVSRFDGMFAFAYYDLRADCLWLARDRAGMKPLYFCRCPDLLAFASESKALLRHPAVPCRPDLHALVTHVLHQRLDGTWTPFENIQSLKPGTLMRITRKDEQTIAFFDLLRDLDVERIIRHAELPMTALQDRLEMHLTDSVRSHLVSDAPLATTCSGGLDSSLTTALAARQRAGLVSYVADIEGVDVNEHHKAQAVCRALGCELRPVHINQEAFLRRWPLCAYHNDQPHFFAQNVAMAEVAAAAHQDGFKVLITGEGADELFGGYPWQESAFRHWRRHQQRSRWLPRNRFFRRLGKLLAPLRPPDLASFESAPFTRQSDHLGLALGTPRACVIDALARPSRHQALFQKLAPIAAWKERAFLARSFEDFLCHLRVALRSNEKMAMLNSVEMRFPFLSNSMIDFGLHAPFKAKYHGHVTKRIEKQVAEKYLPREIVHAPKVGFGITSRLWAGTEPLLHGGMAATLFKWPATENARIVEHIKTDPHTLFTLLAVEVWARVALAGESPVQLGERLVELAANHHGTSGNRPQPG